MHKLLGTLQCTTNIYNMQKVISFEFTCLQFKSVSIWNVEGVYYGIYVSGKSPSPQNHADSCEICDYNIVCIDVY